MYSGDATQAIVGMDGEVWESLIMKYDIRYMRYDTKLY